MAPAEGDDRDVLPEWGAGTVAVLVTAGPHAIPISTALRAGPRAIVLALARRRDSLQRLREEPGVALSILAGGDVAITAYGRARILAEAMSASDRVAAVGVEVDRIQDHTQPRFVIDDGVRWHWIAADAERQDAEIRLELARLGAGELGS